MACPPMDPTQRRLVHITGGLTGTEHDTVLIEGHPPPTLD